MQSYSKVSDPHAPAPACENDGRPAASAPAASGTAAAAVFALSGQGQVRVSRHAGDLAAILDPAISLAIWNRTAFPLIDALDGFETIRETVATEHVAAILTQAFALQPAAPWHDPLIEDIAALAASFAAIMDVTQVSLRLERVIGDACKRWHTDYVPVRLICTYRGCGTQWIERPGERQHALDTGAVGLFKGRMLAGDQAIVHRSPPIAGLGTERLLLVLDCPPPADIDALWQRALQSGRPIPGHRDGAAAGR